MVLSPRLRWSNWLLEERERERDFRFCFILFPSPWCGKLCEHGPRPCNAHCASLVQLERCVKPFQTQDGSYAFGSWWTGRYVRSMDLHGQTRLKPKQTVEWLLCLWPKHVFLRGWTSHHACCRAFMMVAHCLAAMIQALPALLYLMQRSFER